MVKTQKNMGLWLISLSLIFLFNPNISAVDVLPDFIGYFILSAGISKLADLNFHFAEAQSYFNKIIKISFAQLVCVFLMFGLTSGRERPVAALLFSFTFAVLEILVLPKAFKEFFEGFIYLGSRFDSKAVFQTKKVKRLVFSRYFNKMGKVKVEEVERPNNTTRITRFTIAFVVLKPILATLPEFSALTLNSYDSSSPFVFLYDYIGLLRTFSITISLVLGITWVIKMLLYIHSISSDKDFMKALENKYTVEILPKTHIFIKRAIKLGFTILIIGMVFSLDFYVDTFNILPTFVVSLGTIIGVLALKKHVVKISFALISSFAHLITSCSVYAYSVYFYDRYTLNMTMSSTAAYDSFNILRVIKTVDSAAFFVMFLSLVPIIKHIILNYTGFAPISENNVSYQEKIKYVHTTLSKKLTISTALALLSSVSGIGYILLVRDYNFVWMINFIVTLSFWLSFRSVLNKIVDEVDYKYLLS